MKLTELHEARYHLGHPLVTEIKRAINEHNWKWTRTFEELDYSVFGILKSAFGNPTRYAPEDEESYAVAEWRINDRIQLSYLFGHEVENSNDLTNYLYFKKDLQEARYAGRPPFIERIIQALKNDDTHEEQLPADVEMKYVFQHLSAEFGKPTEYTVAGHKMFRWEILGGNLVVGDFFAGPKVEVRY